MAAGADAPEGGVNVVIVEVEAGGCGAVTFGAVVAVVAVVGVFIVAAGEIDVAWAW